MVFVVYEGDAYLSNSSLYLTAICDSRKKAINVIYGYLVKKYGREEMEQMKSQLKENGQAHGQNSYLIREYELNTFIK